VPPLNSAVRRLMNVGAIAKKIESVPSMKSGTLRFWGDWFGKPYDNQHRVQGCTVEGSALVLRFDGGERLLVFDPRGVEVSEGQFYISDASRVRWEWFYYGRPQTRANLYFMEYTRSGDTISGSTNVDWYAHEFNTSPRAKAVELL